MPKVSWVLSREFCSKFHTFSSSAKILKIGDKVTVSLKVGTFLRHSVVLHTITVFIVYFCAVLWRYEADGTVESTDEILSILSMSDFTCV